MKELEQDWNNLFIKVPVTESVALTASSLAIKYPLKGADAVHLAVAISTSVSLFVASDQQLIKICAKLDIRSYDPSAGKWRGERNSRKQEFGDRNWERGRRTEDGWQSSLTVFRLNVQN